MRVRQPDVLLPGHRRGRAARPAYRRPPLYVEAGAATARVGGDPDLSPIRPRVVIDDRALARQLAFTHTLFDSASSTLAADESLTALLCSLRPLFTGSGNAEESIHRSHSAVGRAREYIEHHWDRQVGLAELAAHAVLSPGRLSRTFHAELGLPPSADQRALRVEHAKRALRAGTPPAAVAIHCGFYDQSHLNRVFKQPVGTTPARYASPS